MVDGCQAYGYFDAVALQHNIKAFCQYQMWNWCLEEQAGALCAWRSIMWAMMTVDQVF